MKLILAFFIASAPLAANAFCNPTESMQAFQACMQYENQQQAQQMQMQRMEQIQQQQLYEMQQQTAMMRQRQAPAFGFPGFGQ